MSPLTEANLRTSGEFVFHLVWVNFPVLVCAHNNKIPRSFILFALRTLEGSLFMERHKLLHPNLKTRMKNISGRCLTVCPAPNPLPLASVSLHTDCSFVLP